MLRLVNKNIKNISMRNLVFIDNILYLGKTNVFLKTSLISDKILVILYFPTWVKQEHVLG